MREKRVQYLKRMPYLTGAARRSADYTPNAPKPSYTTRSDLMTHSIMFPLRIPQENIGGAL